MALRQRFRTASAGGGPPFSAGTIIAFFVLLTAFGLFLFLRQYGFFEGGDRMGLAKRYVESHKEFFVPSPLAYKVYDIPLLIRANDLGSEFWGKTFPGILRAAQDETDRILAYEEIINRRDDQGKHREVDLSEVPRLFDLLVRARRASDEGLYNIASGDIFDFWDIAVERYENWKRAEEASKALQHELDVRKAELTPEEKKKKEGELERLAAILAKDRFLPDMKKLREFIPYAVPSAVVLDETKRSIRITSPNVRIRLKKFFREALFLDILREKLPAEMNYLIYYGDRHGMWKLPKEYVRWTVSIDDPQVLIGDKSLGAVKLAEEQGSWAVVRINEDVVKQDGRFYSLPIDWRTGLPVQHTLAVLVIGTDAVTARMNAYALFIASPEERAAFEKRRPEVPYVVVAREDVLRTERAERDRRTVDYLNRLVASGKPMTRTEILTALVTFENRWKIPADGPKVSFEFTFVEHRPVLVVPASAKERFVTKEQIEEARKKQRERLEKSDPFKNWAKERPDD